MSTTKPWGQEGSELKDLLTELLDSSGATLHRIRDAMRDFHHSLGWNSVCHPPSASTVSEILNINGRFPPWQKIEVVVGRGRR